MLSALLYANLHTQSVNTTNVTSPVCSKGKLNVECKTEWYAVRVKRLSLLRS